MAIHGEVQLENLGSGELARQRRVFLTTDDNRLFLLKRQNQVICIYVAFTYNTTTKETKNVGTGKHGERRFALATIKTRKVGFSSIEK